MPAIVTVNIAPTPNALQKTGAIIFQGGTNLAPGSFSLLTSLASLMPIRAAPLAIASLVWSAGVVTVTTGAPHGVAVGDQFHDGTFMATATGASAFTYQLPVNPGADTSPGTYTPRNSAELTAAATTFFGQGSQQGVYLGHCEERASATKQSPLGITHMPAGDCRGALRAPRNDGSVPDGLSGSWSPRASASPASAGPASRKRP